MVDTLISTSYSLVSAFRQFISRLTQGRMLCYVHQSMQLMDLNNKSSPQWLSRRCSPACIQRKRRQPGTARAPVIDHHLRHTHGCGGAYRKSIRHRKCQTRCQPVSECKTNNDDTRTPTNVGIATLADTTERRTCVAVP